jgi:Fe-S oxidoreductase
VRAPRFDDRSLFRYKPGFDTNLIDTVMDWQAFGGLQRATEMCNNNGACRKATGGAMCPSFRATQEEQHVTRGRANTLRLALSGQLGKDAFTSDEMADTMALCVSCKACKRECPTGVDMAKMKIEFLHHYYQRHSMPLKEKLIAYLPRYAPLAKKLGFLLNLRDRIPGLATLSEKLLGFSRHRPLPTWRRDAFGHHDELATHIITRKLAEAKNKTPSSVSPASKEVVLLVDTFNTYFEPGNARAALSAARRRRSSSSKSRSRPARATSRPGCHSQASSTSTKPW